MYHVCDKSDIYLLRIALDYGIPLNLLMSFAVETPVICLAEKLVNPDICTGGMGQ